MHPVYGYMDTFPHQKNQAPYAQHYYPSAEVIPPQIKVDPSISPAAHETWPYGGYYGSSIPMGCHGCCNHHYYPGYIAFRPPYPHFPSSSHGQGGYPSFPDPYPVHYVPPPHYSSMEQARFDYEKNAPRGPHCCGCLDNSCSRNEDRHIKIEEQVPEVESKSCNSLVPVEFKNSPYPVVWIPPGYVKNREHRKPTEAVKNSDVYPPDTRAHGNLKPSEQDPNVRSGWFPFDINNSGPPKLVEDGKRTNQPNEHNSQFPFPIFWMPYKPEEIEKKDHKVANLGQETAEKSSSNLKAASAQSPGSDDGMSQTRAIKEQLGNEVDVKATERKNARQKIIPVKQLEDDAEGGMTKETEGKARAVAVKGTEHIGEKKPSEHGTKRQSPSSPKTSKLPPVCLRLDPLPKKKNKNGSSSSASPPGHKGKAQESVGDSSKSTSPMKDNTGQAVQHTSCTRNKSKEVEMNAKDREVVKGVDRIAWQDTSDDSKVQPKTQAPVTSQADSREKVAIAESHSSDGDSQTGGGCKAEESTPKETGKGKRKTLTEAEAATVIQCAYRGFEVRRWEPLKKLKQIAIVKGQVAEVRSQIEALESSSDISSDDKRKVVIGETIMSLLLKLDTVQGLHPTVRDIRKSVAKELVSLQEKLDSLNTDKSIISNVKLVEDLSLNTEGAASSFRGLKEDAVHGNSFGENICGNVTDAIEFCQVQVSNNTEPTSGSRSTRTSELASVEKEACEESASKIAAFSDDHGKEEVELATILKNDMNNELLHDDQVLISKTQNEGSELKLHVEPLTLVANENVDFGAEVIAPSCLGEESTAYPGVLNRELLGEEPQRNEQIATGECEALQGKEVEFQSAFDITSLDNEDSGANKVQQPVSELKAEPAIIDLEQDAGRENDSGHHKDAGVEKELLVRTLENEVFHSKDAEISEGKDEMISKEIVALQSEELVLPSKIKERKNSELLETSEPQKPDSKLSPSQEHTHGRRLKEDGEMTKNEENITAPEKEVPIQCSRESEMTVGGVNHEMVEDKRESQELESVNQEMVEDKRESEALEAIAGKDEVGDQQEEALIEPKIVPASAEQVEVEGELLPISPTASQVSMGGDIGSGSDKKVHEENEKLKEMVEKLIEAGKDQLTAISNLSGRVQDLEKKLSKKKKMRTRHFRRSSQSQDSQPIK